MTDYEEFDLAYPLLTYDRFGREFRWQLFQFLSFAGGQRQDEAMVRRFTVFPLYFQQRSAAPGLNYTALFPLYGHLKGRLFRSEIDFALWPLYVKTTRRSGISAPRDGDFETLLNSALPARPGEITTYNFPYPIFHLRHGDGLKGWQVWPLAGHERKGVTSRTDDWGDVESVPGHDKQFILWPLFFNETRGIGSDNPERQHALLPFYNYLRSPRRDSTSYLWPLGVTITEDRARGYREVDAPWPFIVFARGEGKHTSRVWPFFSRASNTNLQSDFYAWPVYGYRRIQSGVLDRERTRILFFLYSDIIERNTATAASRRRTDLWPLFTHQRRLDGGTRLQILAPLEPVLPNSKSIERNYSPVWSLWRAEHNAVTGAGSQSLLWNLYRRETGAGGKKCSLLFGLFQYESRPETKRWRLFYIPVSQSKARPQPATSVAEPAAP